MSKPKLTGWYSGDQKPLPDRIGPYKRKYVSKFVYYCWWNGSVFGLYCHTKRDCVRMKDRIISDSQSLPWRGVAARVDPAKLLRMLEALARMETALLMISGDLPQDRNTSSQDVAKAALRAMEETCPQGDKP